jgi:hypothetical protein
MRGETPPVWEFEPDASAEPADVRQLDEAVAGLLLSIAKEEQQEVKVSASA